MSVAGERRRSQGLTRVEPMTSDLAYLLTPRFATRTRVSDYQLTCPINRDNSTLYPWASVFGKGEIWLLLGWSKTTPTIMRYQGGVLPPSSPRMVSITSMEVSRKDPGCLHEAWIRFGLDVTERNMVLVFSAAPEAGGQGKRGNTGSMLR